MQRPFIVGEKLYLRALEAEDVKNYYHWLNDSEVTKYTSHGIFPVTREEEEKWYSEVAKSKNTIVLAIVDKKTDTHIGNCTIENIDWVSRRAEYALIIGEKEFWGKGYGIKVAKLMIAYAFDKLNLRKVYFGVPAEMKRYVKKLTEELGAFHEGLWKEELYRDGKYYDIIRMSVFRKDYYASTSKHRKGLK